MTIHSDDALTSNGITLMTQSQRQKSMDKIRRMNNWPTTTSGPRVCSGWLTVTDAYTPLRSGRSADRPYVHVDHGQRWLTHSAIGRRLSLPTVPLPGATWPISPHTTDASSTALPNVGSTIEAIVPCRRVTPLHSAADCIKSSSEVQIPVCEIWRGQVYPSIHPFINNGRTRRPLSPIKYMEKKQWAQ